MDTDYENYAVMYRCLPQHGSYLQVMARTPELDDEFLENIMFNVMYKLPNFNFQTLIRDHQGYFRCNYIGDDHHHVDTSMQDSHIYHFDQTHHLQ